MIDLLNRNVFWNFIKSLRKVSTGISPLKDKGRRFKNPNDKATMLNKQYVSVHTYEDQCHVPSPSDRERPRLQKKEFRRIFKRLIRGKQHVQTLILYLSSYSRIMLQSYFSSYSDTDQNTSLQECTPPENWRHANVPPSSKRELDMTLPSTDQSFLPACVPSHWNIQRNFLINNILKAMELRWLRPTMKCHLHWTRR